MVVSCPSPCSPWLSFCSRDAPPAAIRRGTSVIVVGYRVLVLGHHRRVVVFSCHLIPIVVVVHPGELVPDGRWCSLLSSLAASTHNPPCEQWLTGLGVGAGSSVVVVGSWAGCWAVPCHRRTLVHGFIRGGWLSNVVVGHGVCSFRGHRCSTFIT